MFKVFISLESNKHTSAVGKLFKYAYYLINQIKIPRVIVDRHLFFNIYNYSFKNNWLAKLLYCSSHIESFICYFFIFKKNPNDLELAAVS